MAAITTILKLPQYLVEYHRVEPGTRTNFQLLRNLAKQSNVCLGIDTAESSQDNDTSEQDRYIYQLTAGNFILAGSLLSFNFGGLIAGSGDKNIRLYLDAVECLQLDISTGSKTWWVKARVYPKTSTTQVVLAEGGASDGTFVSQVTSTSVDLTIQKNFKLTGQCSVGSSGAIVNKLAQADIQFAPFVSSV